MLASARNRNTIDLCERAAEKSFAQCWLPSGIPGRISHQLDELVDAIPDDNPTKPWLRGIEYIAARAMSQRDPRACGRFEVPPQALELQDAIDKVAAALTEVAERFGVDLDQPDAPARRPGPIR